MGILDGFLDGLRKMLKDQKTLRISPKLLKLVEQGKSYELDEKYKISGGKIGYLIGGIDSLPSSDKIEFILARVSAEDAQGFEWRSSQEVVNRIEEELGNEISDMKEDLKILNNLSSKGEPLTLVDEDSEYISVSISEIEEVLSKEITRAERMKEELTHYADLSIRALNSYVANYSDRLSPPRFTERDCDELIEFTLTHDVVSENEDNGYGIENIAEIRRKLSMPESSRLNEVLLTRVEEGKAKSMGISQAVITDDRLETGHKRGLQERLDEINRDDGSNLGNQDRADKPREVSTVQGRSSPDRSNH